MKQLIISLIAVLGFWLPAPTWSQQGAAGNTGLAFLKIGIGGRSSALAEAAVAGIFDASATYWNPANLVYAANQVFFAHSEWLADIRNEYLAVRFTYGKTAVGVFAQLQNIGGIMQRRAPSTEPTAEIAAHEVAFGISLARRVRDTWSAGVSVKYLGERIWAYAANGFAVDLGMHYRPQHLQQIALAVSIHNLGRMEVLRQERPKLPTYLRIGILYEPDLFSDAQKFRLYAGMRKLLAGSTIVGFGSEWNAGRSLSLRAGYMVGQDSQSISAGLGVQIKHYLLDYAYVPFRFDLGNTHKLSLTILF